MASQRDTVFEETLPLLGSFPRKGFCCVESRQRAKTLAVEGIRGLPQKRDIILAHCTHCACPSATQTRFLPVWTAPLETAPLGFCFVCFVKFFTWRVSGVNNSPCPIWSWGCSCFSPLSSYTDPALPSLDVPLLTKVSLDMACRGGKDTDWARKRPLDYLPMRSQGELMIKPACETHPSPTGKQPPATIGKIPIQRSTHGMGRHLWGTPHSYVFYCRSEMLMTSCVQKA